MGCEGCGRIAWDPSLSPLPPPPRKRTVRRDSHSVLSDSGASPSALSLDDEAPPPHKGWS